MKIKSYYDLVAGIAFLLGALFIGFTQDIPELWITFLVMGFVFIGRSFSVK